MDPTKIIDDILKDPNNKTLGNVLKKILQSEIFSIKKFKPKPNTNVIIGLVDRSQSRNRNNVLTTLQDILLKHPGIKKKFPGLKIPDKLFSSVTVKTGKTKKKKFQSSAKVLSFEHSNKKYAVLLKLVNPPDFDIGPQDFNLSGHPHEIDTYFDKVADAIFSRANDLDEYFFPLTHIVEIAASSNSNGKNSQTLRWSKSEANINDLFSDDVARSVVNKINNDFAEVIGPFFVVKYLQAKTNNNEKYAIEFPVSKTQGLFDFTVIRSKSTELLFSVKSGATTTTNTIKPQFLIEEFQKLPVGKKNEIKRNFKQELELLQGIHSRSSEQGRKWVFDEWEDENKTKKGMGFKTPANLKEQTLKMNFNGLYLSILGKKISYFKMNFNPANRTLEYQIFMNDDLIKLLKGTDKLYLRDKGKKDKIGLTPP
jgi:hypothetical protein